MGALAVMDVARAMQDIEKLSALSLCAETGVTPVSRTVFRSDYYDPSALSPRHQLAMSLPAGPHKAD